MKTCLLYIVIIVSRWPLRAEGQNSGCPNGWLIFESSCYLFSTVASTFEQGVEFCNNKSAYVVSIETAAENTYLKQKVQQKGGDYWIGLTDIAKEGTWVWNGTGKIATFTNWGPDEPNDSGNDEDCAHIYHPRSYAWNDIGCHGPYPTICEKGKDCGSLGTLSRGTVDVSGGTLVGASAKYTCNSGYFLEGNATRKCKSNGTWTGKAPTCKPKDCGSPTHPEHGTVVTGNGTTFGMSVKYTCNEGYDLEGDSVRTCKQDKTWTGTTPTCDAKNCGNVTAPDNGAMDDSQGTTFGKYVVFTCDSGYYVEGGNALMCMEDGKWNGSSPICYPKDCGNLTIPDYGSMDDRQGTTFGMSLMFTCDGGYYIEGDEKLTCMEDGSWNGSSPLCKPKDCGNLTIPQNGGMDGSQGTTFGMFVIFTCNDGYYIEGERMLTCIEDGNWNGSSPLCIPKDCGSVTAPDNGAVDDSRGTTYGKYVVFTCDSGYYIVGEIVHTCMEDGKWNGSSPICYPKDCGNLTIPDHGGMDGRQGTTFGKSVTFMCNDGYYLDGNETLMCMEDGNWNGSAPTCSPNDCGHLDAPVNGIVDTSAGTTFQDIAGYTCNGEYNHVGDKSRECLSTGQWSGLEPSCIKTVPLVCPVDIDYRGMEWNEALPGEVRKGQCPKDVGGKKMTGGISRRCRETGVWMLPINDCVRAAVEQVKEKVSALSTTSTAEEFSSASEELANVSAIGTTSVDNNTLSNGELSAVASSLEKVSTLVLKTTKVTDKIANSLTKAANDLIDGTNGKTWEAMRQSDDNAAEQVITAMGSLAEAVSVQMKTSTHRKTSIEKNNLVLEVKKLQNEDMNFPDMTTNPTQPWIRDSLSSVHIPAKAFAATPSEKTQFVSASVMYRDMSKVLPTSQANNTTKFKHLEMYGTVLALTVTPPLDLRDHGHHVQIVFGHSSKKHHDKRFCSYWQFQSGKHGYWSTNGCDVISFNVSQTICQCNHLTNFAVLMSPFVESTVDSTVLRAVSIVGLSVSLLGLIVTLIVHIRLWRYVRSNRTIVLMNLCAALTVSYVMFLAGIDRTENKTVCTFIAVALHYMYLAVFTLMLAEGVELGIMVLFVFDKKSRVKPLLISAWSIPALIVSIALGASQAEGYGNENFCWLSISNGLIWAFVGPALVIIMLNFVCLILVLRTMFTTKAMEHKKKTEKIKSSVHSLCVLVPLMGISWVLGIFYINEDLAWMQYVFAACNGLQGFVIFVFHCLLNPQIKKAIHKKQYTLSSSRSTFKSTFKSAIKSNSSTMKSKLTTRDLHFSNNVFQDKHTMDLSHTESSSSYGQHDNEQTTRVSQNNTKHTELSLPENDSILEQAPEPTVNSGSRDMYLDTVTQKESTIHTVEKTKM